MADQKRKLAAILSADVVGYSRLMRDDEAATVATLQEYRAAVGRVIDQRGGRVVNAPGDNILAEFVSAVEAVQAAVEIQRNIEGRNAELPETRRMQLRVGVNLGDVIEEEDGTIYGDGVNVAARMESLADSAGICVSSTVYDAVEGKLDFGFDFLGAQPVKDIDKPVRVYRVRAEAGSRSPKGRPRVAQRLSLVVGALAGIVAAVVVGWWVTQGPVALQQETAEGSLTNDPILAMPTGPAIAVLPFENISDDESQDYFSDGVTEDIITELSRFDEIHVISRNSTFQFKDKAVDVRKVAQDLGADYIVEGSVRRASNRIRVTAQLLDAGEGTHLWADSYDRQLTADNIFDVQDEIVGQVVTTIADAYGIIATSRLQIAQRSEAHDLGAYECVLRAHEYYGSSDYTVDAAKHLVVRTCLEEAVKTDPTYADAWIWLAGMYRDEAWYGHNAIPDPWGRMEAVLRRGLDLDSNHQAGHAFLADLYKERKQEELFFEAARRAIELNPNSANILAWMGAAIATWGQWDQGIPLMRKGVALSHTPPAWMFWTISWDHYRRGEYEESLSVAMKGYVNWPPFRPDSRRKQGGLGIALSMCLCLMTFSGSK